MSEVKQTTIYFSSSGKENTKRTLEIAKEFADRLKIKHVLVASNSGTTGYEAAKLMSDQTIINVTHSTGFKGPDTQELLEDMRLKIESLNGKILTCQHALGGINRAVRKKFNTYQLDEIIAHTLRLQGQGFKVAVEIALMAADAGLVRTDEPVISIGGTKRGADTAVLLFPVNAQDFFNLKITEILCRPSPFHPILKVE